MAWTAKVADKKYINGSLKVSVEYNDGTDAFTDVLDLTGGDIEVAKQKVRDRLQTLNATDALASKISVGNISLNAIAPAATPLGTFLNALARFRRCKMAVEVGLITIADQVYVDAQNAMKAAWDVSFIDSL